MKLGDLLRIERERRCLTVERVAGELQMTEEEYQRIEEGDPEVEEWAPLLAEIAVALDTPATPRLIADTGRAKDAVPGECGRRIARHREGRGLSLEDAARMVGIDVGKLALVERGESPLERWGWRLLRFAELVDLPLFNLFYPRGVALRDLDQYP